MSTSAGWHVAQVQPIIQGWKRTSVEKVVINKHENESAPWRSPNWFGSLIFFFCVLAGLSFFQGDKKVKWHGWKWGERGKGSLWRIPNETRDTEWNVNSRRRLAEWQSTYHPQRERLTIAESWHLGRPLNCDSFSPVFKAQLDYLVRWHLLLATNGKNLNWTGQKSSKMVCPVLYGPCHSHCYAGGTFRPLQFSHFLWTDSSISDNTDNSMSFGKKGETKATQLMWCPFLSQPHGHLYINVSFMPSVLPSKCSNQILCSLEIQYLLKKNNETTFSTTYWWS